jgi:hypothetical protein
VAALTKLREISSGDSALSLYAVQEASEGEAGAT